MERVSWTEVWSCLERIPFLPPLNPQRLKPNHWPEKWHWRIKNGPAGYRNFQTRRVRKGLNYAGEGQGNSLQTYLLTIEEPFFRRGLAKDSDGTVSLKKEAKTQNLAARDKRLIFFLEIF